MPTGSRLPGAIALGLLLVCGEGAYTITMYTARATHPGPGSHVWSRNRSREGLTPDPGTTPCPEHQFNRLLSEVIEDKLMAEGADWLIFQPGIYEILCYHFAAQVLLRSQREQASP